MSNITETIENVIRQAIKGEEDSYAIYTSASKRVTSAPAKALLEELAKEELGHKAKLEGLLQKRLSWNIARGQFKRVTDLKLGDHLVAKPLEEGADFQTVLTVAIQREKDSHELYATMASIACDETVHNLFEFLANEELTHKRKLESLYEDTVYQHF